MSVTLPNGLTYERTCDEDGFHHFNQLKKISQSGWQYLEACNGQKVTTPAMLLGTIVHFLVLGPRHGAKPLVCFDGARRQGKAWDEFKAANVDAEIATRAEWERAEEIAKAVLANPLARARFDGARFEVPLVWEEAGLKFSTSGVDIVTANGAAGDLKTTSTTFPDAWRAHAVSRLYPEQMVFYRRGLAANGIECPRGLFILGVETRPPYEVVDLNLTPEMIERADRAVTFWIEKLRGYKESNQWPGYAQQPIDLDVSEWARTEDGANTEDDDAAA